MTIEKFYEFLLEKETAANPTLEYRHGKALADGYLTAEPEKLFQSDIGRGILNAIQCRKEKLRIK